MLSIVNYILKFQDDLLNQKFLLRVDCKATKDILEKDVKNLASKHILLNGKPYWLYFTLILNISNGILTLSLIFSPVNFCRGYR